MTISTTNSLVMFQGNGVTTIFPFDFNIPASSYIQVSLQDVVTLAITEILVPGSYLVTGYDDPTGGSVTYPLSGAPISSAYNLLINRIVPYTQDLDIENQGGFFPETLEQQLDFMVMQTQQIANTLSRAVLVPPGSLPPTDLNGNTFATAAQGLLAETSAQSILTLTAVRAMTGVLPKTIIIGGSDGGIFTLDTADITSAEDGGIYCGTVIRSVNYANDGVYKRFIIGVLDAKAFGVLPSQTDNILLLHAARDASLRLGVELQISATGPLQISDHFTLKNNLRMRWVSPTAFFKLTARSTSGAVVTTIEAVAGIPMDRDVINCWLFYPLVDGNNIQAQNGIGIGGTKGVAGATKGVRIRGGYIKNCLRDTVGIAGVLKNGGRAVTFQLGLSDCDALDFVAESCTTAGDIHGWSTVAFSQATAVTMRYHSENCDEGFSAYDLQALGGDNYAGINCDVEFTAHNCGLAVRNAAAGTDGGAIVFERASYCRVRANIINDAGYGKIGGVVRGKGYHHDINVNYIGDCVALVNANGSLNLAPVVPNNNTPFQNNTIFIDHIKGSCDNVLAGDTAAHYQFNHVRAIADTIVGNIILAPIDDSTTSSLYVLRRSDGTTAEGMHTDFKGYFPTLGSTFKKFFGNLLKLANMAVNISGGEAILNTQSAMNIGLAYNNSIKLRVVNNGVQLTIPSYASDAAAGTGGLTTDQLYYNTTTRVVTGKS